MFSYDSFGAAFVVLAVIIAILGWAVIEGILWILSFVHISFG